MNRRPCASALGLVLVALVFWTGCSSSNSTSTPPPPTITITATSGSGQSATVATAFASQLVATVKTNGSATSGATVTFTAPGTGASGTFSGGKATATATTDANGNASATFTANTAAGGPYTVTASATGATTPASFSLTNTAGAAAAVTATSGTSQNATVGTAFATALGATVVDSFQNPVSGVTVTFTAPATGASGTFAGGTNTATAATNSSGVASVPFTANGKVGGPYTVTASVTGVSTPGSFSLTNTVGAAASVTATSGTPQSATVGTAFATALGAMVVDSFQNPVSGVTVTFTAPGAGATGTFPGGKATATATTDANGNASATFTANTVSGAYLLAASVTGATPASFSLTNIAGAPAGITATQGTPQSATVTTEFLELEATVVDSFQNPVSGAVVTFGAPGAGPSGTFAGTPPTLTTTSATNSSGVAAAMFTANVTTGGPYTVTATIPGAPAPANFILTNTGGIYSFYLSGLEAVDGGPLFYALAGSVAIATNGDVAGGEQDYNDGAGFTSPQPSGDAILPGTAALVVDSTGQGTLTLTTNNTNLGVGGVETLGVQFVNPNHALIVQFDGSATSSGSMDLQTLPSTLGGLYAFTFSGVDAANYQSTVSGGVFSINGVQLEDGVVDTNDAGTVTLGIPLSGLVSAPDSFGRGNITGVGPLINYYIIGPEAMRIIDVDAGDSGIGSVFGRGTGTFTSASIGALCSGGQVCSAFGLESNSWGAQTLISYAAAGTFTAIPNPGTIGIIVQGVADNDEYGLVMPAVPITGTYSVANSVNGGTINGYGSMTVMPLGDIFTLGIYLTDPNLNLLDPNNTTSGLGGALIADMDPPLQGTGVLIPQTDTAAADFTGNYAFGAQEFNFNGFWEWDFVGQGSVAYNAGAQTNALNATGLVSDPGLFFGAGGTNGGVGISGTATPDPNESATGRYTIPLVYSLGGAPFDVVIYQASGGQLLWLDEDGGSLFLGFLEQQGSLAGLPGAKKGAAAKTKPQRAASTAR